VQLLSQYTGKHTQATSKEKVLSKNSFYSPWTSSSGRREERCNSLLESHGNQIRDLVAARTRKSPKTRSLRQQREKPKAEDEAQWLKNRPDPEKKNTTNEIQKLFLL
jgi:hypothetical protein